MSVLFPLLATLVISLVFGTGSYMLGEWLARSLIGSVGASNDAASDLPIPPPG